MPEKRHLSETAAREIAQLQSKGIALTHDDIVWINDLAREVEQPSGGSTLPAGQPAKAGNVWLWPFTLLGSSWYESIEPWFNGSTELNLYAIAFALAHGRTTDILPKLCTYKETKRAIKKWAKALPCTVDELMSAVEIVLPVDNEVKIEEKDLPPEIEDAQRRDPCEDVAALVAVCGGTPEMWATCVDIEYLNTQARVVMAQAMAEAGDGKPKLDPHDPVVLAVKNLSRCIYVLQGRKKDG